MLFVICPFVQMKFGVDIIFWRRSCLEVVLTAHECQDVCHHFKLWMLRVFNLLYFFGCLASLLVMLVTDVSHEKHVVTYNIFACLALNY